MLRILFTGTVDASIEATMVEMCLGPRTLTDSQVAAGYRHTAEEVANADPEVLVARLKPTWFRNCPCEFCDRRRDPHAYA
jgi:hypothetical protein